MKLNLSLLGLILTATIAFGQQAKYPGFSAAKFQGIKTEDGNLFYTTYRGEAQVDTPYNYVIQVFNSELQRVSNLRVPTAWNSEIVDVEGHNGGLLFYVQSKSDAKIFHFNDQGKKEWQKTIELDKNKYTNAEMRSLGKAGFIIVRPNKEDKNGFKVTLYDNQLNEKWSQGDYPEKGRIDYRKVQVAGNKIGILAEFTGSIFSGDKEERLYVLSAEDGSIKYQHVLGTADNNQNPEDFILNADGSAFALGYIYDSDKVPDELFYSAINPAGEARYFQKFPVQNDIGPKIASKRAEENFNLPEDRFPIIAIHKILKTADGYKVVGEKYNYEEVEMPVPENGVKVGASQKGKLMVQDYLVLDISNTGKLSAVKNISKPHKLVNTVGPAIQHELFAHESLEEYDLYSYRHMAKMDGAPTIVSLNWHRNTPYIGFTSLDASHENILNRVYLDKKVSEEHRANEVTEATLNVAESINEIWTTHYGVLSYHKPGKMLFYEYEGGEVSMEVMDMKAKMPEPENGELNLTGIPAQEFEGLMAIEGKGYYTFYLSEKSEGERKLYVYHRLDKGLNTTGRSVLSVPERARFSGNVNNGRGQTIVFQDAGERAWYFYSLDSSGVLISENSISLSETANQVPTGNLLLEPASDGFTMIQPYADTAREINGYQVIRLDNDMNTRWSYAHEAQKNEAIQLNSTAAGNGIIAIIHNQYRYLSGDNVQNQLLALDDKNGNLLFKQGLQKGENAGFPQFVKVTDDKSIVTSGMYFKDKRFSDVNSEGLFLLKVNAKGEETFYTETPWEKVEEAIKKGTDTEFLLSGKTKVLIQNMIVAEGGGIKVVGELYRKSLGTTGIGFLLGDDLNDRAFSIFDFTIFDYDKSGKLTKMYRMPKEEQNIEVPGNTGYQRGLALSLMMRKYNMFSYLKTLDKAGEQNLIFTNTVNREKHVYSTPITASANGEYPKAPATYPIPKKAPDQMNNLEEISNKLDSFGEALDEKLTGTDQTFTTFKDPHNGFAVAVPYEVLTYYYDKNLRRLLIKLEEIN